MKEGLIKSINGPVVVGKNMADFKMREMVVVGEKKLIGEVITIEKDLGTVQVYEETSGLKRDEKIIPTGAPLSVKLGPGLISNMFDGIERPLQKIKDEHGNFMPEGIGLISLDEEKLWDVKFEVKVGDMVEGGMIFGTVKETEIITHRLLIPIDVKGKITSIVPEGKYNIETELLEVEDEDGVVHKVKMYQEWPVRIPRPVKNRLPIDRLLVTGQRVFDVFFPIAKGGTTAVPGGFGTGKTMTQHQIAKYCDADIIVYIGCGERGNEMTEVLEDFPKLIDPHTNKPLMDRTILIANTSNMPVAAREASIYTGVTIAEYFRDQGYHVALMGDSTSRWAEALREMSGRLEEMPGDEGYPAYLASRIADFYERAGKVKCLGSDGRDGSLTVIGAVSPPGGDISEPVTQSTLRIVKVFWGLDYALSYMRHFPAINWINSYSLYQDKIDEYLDANVDSKFSDYRKQAMKLLQEESSLLEIVRLVGRDSLSDEDQIKLETSKSLREDFLQQNAFHETDTFCSLDKQAKMLDLILTFHKESLEALQEGAYVSEISKLPVREKITRAKNIPEDELQRFDEIKQEIKSQITDLVNGGER